MPTPVRLPVIVLDERTEYGTGREGPDAQLVTAEEAEHWRKVASRIDINPLPGLMSVTLVIGCRFLRVRVALNVPERDTLDLVFFSDGTELEGWRVFMNHDAHAERFLATAIIKELDAAYGHEIRESVRDAARGVPYFDPHEEG